MKRKFLIFSGCLVILLTLSASLYAQSHVLSERQEQIVKEIDRLKIHFKTGSSEISPDSLTNLINVAEGFRQLPAGSLLEIASFTDNAENKGQGKDADLKLAEARSAAVVKALVKLGIDAALLSSKNFGSAQPIGDNAAVVGRAMNRRTEFKVAFAARQELPSTPAESNSESSKPAADPCPVVSVSSPDAIAAGSPITFTADVSGGDPQVTPTFTWFISAGEIISGQGTSIISVSAAKLKAGDSVTATIDVGGFERSCSVSASGTTALKMR